MYNVKHKEVGRAIIDKDDVEKVKGYKWNLKNNDYCSTTVNTKQLYLHHLILEKPAKGYVIDHRNHNPLDNRKSNLRFATYSQNNINKKNTKGYWFEKSRNKWTSQISFNYKRIYLGRFEKEEDVIKARIEAEKKYFAKI